jgi:hypothetical protein
MPDWLRELWFGMTTGVWHAWGQTRRSPAWGPLRDRFVAENPFCAGCSKQTYLEVHHIQPFHVRPDLECDEFNLIVLCRDCHYTFGHLRDWRLSNTHVIEDAAVYRRRYTEARADKA